MTAERTLLADYAVNGSEKAFREVVTRYIDLVYSTAVRLVYGDTHLAEDVVQMVFADLARLARTLSPEVMRHPPFTPSSSCPIQVPSNSFGFAFELPSQPPQSRPDNTTKIANAQVIFILPSLSLRPCRPP